MADISSCCNQTGWKAPWERCACGCKPDLSEMDRWFDPAIDRIDKLFPEEKLIEIRDRWLKIGLSTEPTDIELAKAGISEAYRIGGLEPPKHWIRFDDPKRGIEEAFKLLKQEKSVKDQIQIPLLFRNQIRNQISDQIWNQIRDQFSDQLWGQIRGQIRNQIWNQIWNQISDQIWNQIWNHACFGQHDAHRLAYYQALSGLKGIHKLKGLWAAAMATGWFFPFEKTVILTERPSILHWRDGKCIHIEYPNGWTISKLSSLERLAIA